MEKLVHGMDNSHITQIQIQLILGIFLTTIMLNIVFSHNFGVYYSAGQGFSILKPPSVSGWPPYYQDPIFDMFWLNSDTLQKRKKMLSAYGKYGFAFQLENGVYGRLYPDPMVFLSMFENPGNFELFIEELIEMYLNIEIEDSEKTKKLERLSYQELQFLIGKMNTKNI